MKALISVAIVALVAATVDARASIHDEFPIDWYDCSEKEDGNYLHPFDCTRFISCFGGFAAERDCPPCNENDTPGRCKDGRLVYEPNGDYCGWADEVTCQVGERESQEITDPTEEPTEGPTEGPTEDPKPDPECDPELCKNNGTCQWYWRCNEEGRLVREECDRGLIWNPLNPDGSDHVHGGNCDTWENLSPEIVDEYRKDKECLACFWEALGECERDYKYQAAGLRHRDVQTLSCAEGLVFSQEKETCRLCSAVTKADGGTCC